LLQLRRYTADAFLLDAYVPGVKGGTGSTFDWRWAQSASAHAPIILAGGLTPDNVIEAIRIVHPYAVDVCSGVESRPGKKDGQALRQFISAVRAAE
jgi:phosphoribosylanthranilate isomerase